MPCSRDSRIALAGVVAPALGDVLAREVDDGVAAVELGDEVGVAPQRERGDLVAALFERVRRACCRSGRWLR